MKFGQLIEYNKKYFSSKLSFSTFRYPSTNLNILRTKRAFFHHFLRAFSCQKLPEAWKCALKFNVFEIRESPLRPNTQLLHESVKLLHLRNSNWKRRSTVICFHWYKLQGSEWSKSLNSKLTRINIYWGYQQISSVKRQKGKSQDGCNKKTKHTKFSEERKFLTPWYAYVRFTYTKVVFGKIWRALFSCYTRLEIRPFALLPTI